jgi:hypothetical protein
VAATPRQRNALTRPINDIAKALFSLELRDAA